MGISGTAMRPGVKIALLLVSLAGAVYCLLNAAGANFLCLTEGCRIYAGYGLFGLSFYVYGGAFFLAIFLLTLLHPRWGSDWLLWGVLGAGLLGDALFLAWQTLFWPCVSCLLVALLLGVAAAAALFHFSGPRRRWLAAAGALWLLFFLMVSLNAGREIALRPWPAFGSPAAPVQVFFSPDCPACQQTIRQILDDPQAADRTAFYPIAKNAEDRRRIAAFLDAIGPRTADRLSFLALFDPAAEAPSLGWQGRWRLLANKSALARTGASSVPLVISPGVLQVNQRLPFDFNPFTEAPLFPGPTATEGCSAFEEKPCD